MQGEFNEEVKTQDGEETAEAGFAYKTVMKGEGKRRTFSVVSLIISVISIFFVFPPVGITLGVTGVVLSLISRKNLGYFDGFSIAGLIVGIFGIVFGIAWLSFGALIISVFF